MTVNAVYFAARAPGEQLPDTYAFPPNVSTPTFPQPAIDLTGSSKGQWYLFARTAAGTVDVVFGTDSDVRDAGAAGGPEMVTFSTITTVMVLDAATQRYMRGLNAPGEGGDTVILWWAVTDLSGQPIPDTAARLLVNGPNDLFNGARRLANG